MSSERPFEVLIVDDDEDVRELLVEYFRGRKIAAAAAADGRAAITALEREPDRFALVITDLQLPGACGLDILRTARQLNPSCHVVIITGYASLDSAIQAVRLGAYDFLTKPFSLGQIELVVRRVQDRAQLETENRQLARKIEGRDPVARKSVAAQLDGIEQRLARIEALLLSRDGRNRTRSD